jgi:flagellar motor switch protein FliG
MSGKTLPEPAGPPAAGLSKAQKAAVILCLLHRDGAAPVFENLGEAAVKNFVRAMAQIGNIDGKTVQSIIAEFLSHMDRSEEAVQCGANNALQIVERNLGRAAAARISDSVDMFSEKNVWKRIAMVSPEVVSSYLEREHSQTAAVILTKLPPEYAGRVVSGIAPEQAKLIAKCFPSMQGVEARSAEIIGDALGSFLNASRLNASALTPAERIGAIMNYASSQSREELIEHLEELDPEFSESVRRCMFTFADIEKRVEHTDVAKIVRAVEQEVLVKALVGDDEVTERVRGFMLSNISNRMSEMIQDEIKDAGNVKRKDTEKAQANIIQAIVALESSGEIELIKDGEE